MGDEHADRDGSMVWDSGGAMSKLPVDINVGRQIASAQQQDVQGMRMLPNASKPITSVTSRIPFAESMDEKQEVRSTGEVYSAKASGGFEILAQEERGSRWKSGSQWCRQYRLNGYCWTIWAQSEDSRHDTSSQAAKDFKEASDYFTSHKTTTSGNITDNNASSRVDQFAASLSSAKNSYDQYTTAGHAAMSTVKWLHVQRA
jgi:conjugal transfer mating pair stabilization protein TraG